ncbi:MAG: hypothetical protein QNK23_02800 [Crocinitomicaceae bacterium]|nr:hypothetical protein [Crocinitomicaceae bacterium]
MLVSPTNLSIAATIAGVIVFAIVYFIVKRILGEKLGTNGVLITAALAGLIMIIYIKGSAPTVIIIEDGYTINRFESFGEINYELTDGTFATGTVGDGKTAVINNSSDSLVIETVEYGDGDFTGNLPRIMLPCSFHNVYIADEFNYYFDNEPPEEMLVEENKTLTVYWLRRMNGNE